MGDNVGNPKEQKKASRQPGLLRLTTLNYLRKILVIDRMNSLKTPAHPDVPSPLANRVLRTPGRPHTSRRGPR